MKLTWGEAGEMPIPQPVGPPASEASRGSLVPPAPEDWLSTREQIEWLKQVGYSLDDAKILIIRERLKITPRRPTTQEIADIDWENDRLPFKHRENELALYRTVYLSLARQAFDFYGNVYPKKPLPSSSTGFRQAWANTFARGDRPRGPGELNRAVIEQRPAAYRFDLRDDRIDTIPEPPAPIDREIALDTYQELVRKARALRARLIASNSVARVRDSIDALLAALGECFDDVRPGVLLSRSRSIEADRAAFDTDEGRAELFPDAIAMMEDTAQTLRDLLAVLPIVRQIERERLALDLDRHREAIPAIRDYLSEIEAAAQASDAATDNAAAALGYNDKAIDEASDPLLQTSLIADQVLVHRNFVSKVLDAARRELGDLGGRTWNEIKNELPKGVGETVRAAPKVALLLLAVYLGGPIAGMATAVRVWKPLADLFKRHTSDEKPADTKEQ